MNRAQKIAWLFVITISLAAVISCIAFIVAYFMVGMPRALASLGFMGIAGIGGSGPLIFGKDKGNVTSDERDKQIERRAALASFGASYMVVGAVCMIPFFILGPEASISITWLPSIFGAAGICAFFTHSVAILIQYREGAGR
jgi:hypothetical protein